MNSTIIVSTLGGIKTIEGRFSKKLFWLKGGRGFQKCIPSNLPITY